MTISTHTKINLENWLGEMALAAWKRNHKWTYSQTAWLIMFLRSPYLWVWKQFIWYFDNEKPTEN